MEESDEDGFEDTHIVKFEQAMIFDGRPPRARFQRKGSAKIFFQMRFSVVL